MRFGPILGGFQWRRMMQVVDMELWGGSGFCFYCGSVAIV